MEYYVEVLFYEKLGYRYTCYIKKTLHHLEDVLEVYEEVTTKLLVLHALALIVTLLIDAFFSYMNWYLVSLGKLVFPSIFHSFLITN